MRIFITGANSFIGKALVPVLTRQNHLVTCAVRKKSGCMHDFCSAGSDVWFFDTLDRRTDFRQALDTIDVVIHLAARVHARIKPDDDQQNKFMAVNVEGTLNLAQQAAENKIKRFVFISSIGVNGKSTKAQGLLNERDEEKPYNWYTVSKLEAEKALRELSAKTGMEIVIIRPPLVYGPGVKANFLKMLDLVSTGLPLPFAGINNMRSFIAIDNLVDAIAKCVSHEKAAGEVFFVSDDRPLSTPQLVEKISRSLGFEPRLFYLPSFFSRRMLNLVRMEDTYESLWGNMAADSRKIHHYLGWRPVITTDEGIKKTVQWYLEKKTRK